MIRNHQPIEKRTTMYANGHEKLDVHSIFYTIQGEGPFCGTPAVFIRLAGCNLQCPACDTDYTSKRRWMSTDEIVDFVRTIPRITAAEGFDAAMSGEPQAISYFTNGLVVITGGEPLRQSDAVGLLALKLQQRLQCYIQIETNGTLPPPDISILNRDINERRGLYIVVSPKTGKVHQLTSMWACAYKYVMNADSVADDGLPQHALHHKLGTLKLARPPADFKGVVYLQPQDDYSIEENKRNQDACVQSCMRHGYVLQLQTHKILGLE
jgi:7-carboxy-7-deazaguanine synthase